MMRGGCLLYRELWEKSIIPPVICDMVVTLGKSRLIFSSVVKNPKVADCFFGQKFWRAMTSEWEILQKFWSRNQNRSQSQGLPYVKAVL